MALHWLVEAAIAGSLIIFWTLVSAVRMLWNIIRHRDQFFYVKDRKTPPECLVKGWNHAFISLSEVRLHYVETGSVDQPLMLLLHGFPEFWYTWRHQLREFQNDFRVVAVDMRGYGYSDKPKGISNYVPQKLVQDIKELIPALGHSSCVLVGHDWGGFVAWSTATHHPELVDKLVILNCPHPKVFMRCIKEKPKQLLKSWYMFFFQCPLLPELSLRALDMKFFDEAFRKGPVGCRNPDAFTDDDIEAWKFVFNEPGALTPPLNYYRSMFSQAVGGRLSESSRSVSAPTLIIWGTADAALETEMAKASAEFCPSSTVRLIQDASHWVQNDDPKLVNQHIRQFLVASAE